MTQHGFAAIAARMYQNYTCLVFVCYCRGLLPSKTVSWGVMMGSHGPSWLHDDEPHQIKKWVTQTHTKTATVTTA